MIPEHCSNVAVLEVDFELTAPSIRSAFKGRKAYVRTDFAVFRRGEEFAVARLRKAGKPGLFRPVRQVEVLSLPDSTAFVHDPSIDVMNANALGRAAGLHPGKTVVVEGEFGHVNFIHREAPVRVLVFDLTPPSPPKLNALVARALGAYQFGRPIVAQFAERELNALGDALATHPIVYFPCKTAGLSACSPALTRYLDQPPKVQSKPEEAAVVGCSLSLRIFRELYGASPGAFTDVCPEAQHPEVPQDAYLFVKCCKVRPPFQRAGRVFVFPWGVQVDDIVEACQAIAGRKVRSPREEPEGLAPGLTPLRRSSARPLARRTRGPSGRTRVSQPSPPPRARRGAPPAARRGRAGKTSTGTRTARRARPQRQGR